MMQSIVFSKMQVFSENRNMGKIKAGIWWKTALWQVGDRTALQGRDS